MMNKFRKMQETWLSKFILILTAVSFMSLFGVSGYIGSAGKNRPVIKVDNYEVLQSDISQRLEQQMQMARGLFGDNLDINDNIRNAMLQGIVQKALTDTIIRRTADELDISISDNLIRKIIYSQAEFLDADGKFDIQKLRRVLAASGWTEKRYIDSLKLDVIKQHLIQNPVDNINVPNILAEYLAKAENQKKIFKYVKIDPEKMTIDRKISQDEVEQFYEDFSSEFVAPEERDVSFIVLSTDDIAAKINLSDEDIEAYYNENLNQFETPETRNVLQMVFDSQEEADKANAALKEGKDFYAVAKELAKQDREATNLGFVSQDMLIADMSEAVFKAKKGAVVGPVKSEMGWHIMKVSDIKAGSKMDKKQARAKIVSILKKDRAYDEAYEISAQIEDKIGAGAGLSDIAKEMNVKIYDVQGLTEDGKARKEPAAYAALLKSNDFVDTAFSYNVDEVSQVVETDEGFMVLKVNKIVDAHPKSVDEVRGEIEALWEVNERGAIAQEIVNDVMHDLETGDSIESVAARNNLQLHRTAALTRSKNFEAIAPAVMLELFQEPSGSPKLINNDGIQIIAVGVDVVPAEKPSSEEIAAVARRTKMDLSSDYARQLIEDFGSDYDVRVKYRLLGLAD